MGAKGHKAQTFTIEVDENYTASDREAIGEDIVDQIVDDTASGINSKTGKNFRKLSEDYAAYKRKVVGSSKANIKFSGETLGSMRFIKSKSGKGKVTVGYNAGTEANAKAKGHITGEATGKVRNFLQTSKKKINDIVSQYPIEDKEAKKKAIEAALALREKLRGKKES